MNIKTNNRDWFKNAWHRILVDMHIPDWDAEFLSKLTPEKYVEMMEMGRAQEAMIYANSHVGMKTPAQFQTQSFLATAHASAFMFIDAINPNGTLNSAVYEQIREVFDKGARYDSCLGGELYADAAVYYSAESKFDPADNGLSAGEKGSGKVPHHEAVMGACLALQRQHIPFTVITKKNLAELVRYQVLILPDVLVMDDDEAKAIRNYVRAGGSLYASYRTATCRKDGTVPSDFLLADVFGAGTSMEKAPPLTFFTPKTRMMKEWFYPQDHILHEQSQLLVQTRTAEVLASITLPRTDPRAGEIFGPTFGSIHSNPPGPAGRQPAIILNRFGKGKACYAAGNFEMTDHPTNQRVFANLIRLLMKEKAWFDVKTHENIEVVLMHQPGQKRLILALLAVNPALAGTKIPAEVRLRLPRKASHIRATELPQGKNIPCESDGHSVKFGFEQDSVFSMTAIEYS